MSSDLVKLLRSGVSRNRLIETLGGMQHYVSNLKAAERIEELESANSDKSQLLASYLERIKELEAENEAVKGTIQLQDEEIGIKGDAIAELEGNRNSLMAQVVNLGGIAIANSCLSAEQIKDIQDKIVSLPTPPEDNSNGG